MTSCNPAALSEQPFRFREHYYETCDRMEEVRQPAYFAAAARYLAAGDVIKVRAGIPDALDYEEFVVERLGDGVVGLRTLTAAVQPQARPAEHPRDDRMRHQHQRQHGQGGRR